MRELEENFSNGESRLIKLKKQKEFYVPKIEIKEVNKKISEQLNDVIDPFLYKIK